ncbi:MAG TPA: PKD domain-containing protein [Geobacteraceae bacterium]
MKIIYASQILIMTIAALFMTAIICSAGTTSYQYDELDRLKQVTYGDGTIIQYAYDQIGNRLQKNTRPLPAFSATPVTGYFPLSVNFSDLSNGSPTAWLWDFGDGTTSTVQNPSHTYNSQGNYTVSLTASNSLGTNANTQTNYISVQAGTTYPIKIASATPTYYTSLQTAYNAAANGDTIQCQAVALTENLTFNLGKSVTLVGGYDPTFTSSSGVTTIHGAMNITAGAVASRSFNLQN